MAVNVTALNAPRGAVKVEGSWIEASIRFNDEDGAAFLRSKASDEARLDAFETASRIGLRSLESADTAYTSILLDEKLDQMVQQLNRAAETSLAKATQAFQESWTKRIDEELAVRLDTHKKVLDERMQVLFGETSDKSVQQAVRKFLSEYQATVVKEIGDDRARLRRELTELINGAGNPDHPIAKISSQIAELRKEVAVELEAARAAATARETRKGTAAGGFDYQAEVHSQVVELLRGSDDEVELKGRTPGATGGAEGDMVVTVDPALTSGLTARIAVEVTKQATGLSVTKLKTMLKKAKEDRAAQVAIVVIREPAVLGGQRLEFFKDLGAVAVYNPEDDEDFRSLPLLVALKQARVVAVRDVRPAAEERNDEQIERACQKAKDALDAIDGMLGDQTKIIKLAEGTCTKAKELRRGITDALGEIDDALGA